MGNAEISFPVSSKVKNETTQKGYGKMLGTIFSEAQMNSKNCSLVYELSTIVLN